MDPPSPAVYSSLEELLGHANGHAVTRGYKLVVVRSKTNAQGQKTWVHLACDRHGTKRNTHNLTEETRKKNRRSRRCECLMYCVANKTASGLWELTVRHPDHNHGPYEPPPKKKKDMPLPHSSEIVNLPLLQTPSACIADFCLVPIGTPCPSVSAEIAEVQRLLRRSGLNFSMHSAGTTVEGSWDDCMRIIGQAHSLLHGSGVVRIQTDIRIGSRTDKKQSFEDKIAAVQAHLEQDGEIGQDSDDGMGNDMNDTMNDTTMGSMGSPISASLAQSMQSAIAPDLERMLPSNIDPQMSRSMPHPMASHAVHQLSQGHPMAPNYPMAQSHQLSPNQQMPPNHQMGSTHQMHLNQQMNANQQIPQNHQMSQGQINPGMSL